MKATVFQDFGQKLVTNSIAIEEEIEDCHPDFNMTLPDKSRRGTVPLQRAQDFEDETKNYDQEEE